MSQYHTLNQLFTVDSIGPYVGQAVASEEAIYLVTASAPLTLPSLFTGRVGKSLPADNGVFEMSLSDLPAEVIEDASWPIRSRRGFVLVIRRDDVEKMSCTLIGKLRIVTSSHTATIPSGILRRHRLLRTLRQLGWQV